MCGIVGLFLKDQALQPRLGALLGEMLVIMGQRGPDSAGFAIYGDTAPGTTKLTYRDTGAAANAERLDSEIEASLGRSVVVGRRGGRITASVPEAAEAEVRALIAERHKTLRLVGSGKRMELFKEVGTPAEVAARFDMAGMSGTHGVGHTRMATESAITTDGAHPFSTGPDQCLVHDGSLSNHNSVRRMLRHEGISFGTDDDSEVAAGYLTWRMRREGATLREALEILARRSRRLLHLPRRHRERLCRAARRDRLQAGSHGGERRLRRVGLGIPGAVCPPRHRKSPHLRARAGEDLCLGATLDARRRPCGDAAARAQPVASSDPRPRRTTPTGRSSDPRGAHAIAVGIDADVSVTIDGPVGYYCAGMNKRATVTVRGNAGTGVAENMMSGRVHVLGSASQSAGATGRGGFLLIDGDTSARCGISMKGINIVVKGSIGAMSAFMAQAGNLIVLGDAGEALGASIYEARIFVRGKVASLGADWSRSRWARPSGRSSPAFSPAPASTRK